jgi:acyl-coenzyme A synthetase/AMP-(fatty) acid ligase
MNRKVDMTEKTFKGLAHSCFMDFNKNRLLIDSSRNQCLTYAEGFDLIRIVSEKLLFHGLKKGDVVLNYTPLSLESVILCWSCFYNGFVFVPVDHNWPAELLKHILEETAPKLILTDRLRYENIRFSEPCGTVLFSEIDRIKGDIQTLFEWLQTKAPERDTLTEEVLPDDLALILYTSGSTGIPKGVMLSQRAIFLSGSLAASHFRWKQSDLFLNLGDLHAMSGLRNSCFAPLHAGATFLIGTSDERNNALLLLQLIQKFGVHYVGVAPTVVRQLNILYSKQRMRQLHTLKAVLCTGGSLSKEQLKLFFTNYNIPVLNYYGLTETSGLCCGHTMETFHPDDNSIGRAVGAELRIESNQEMEDGEGELLVKSQNLMSGYFKNRQETELVLRDGWFHTGDIVQLRTDGCYELLGRKRNILKNIHSELIFLEEIELAIEGHPIVCEACVCSFAHFEEDEKCAAFVVLKPGIEMELQSATNEIKRYLLEKLGKNRMPWCYYFETSLPRGTSGKVQRQFIKQKLHEYFQSNCKKYF